MTTSPQLLPTEPRAAGVSPSERGSAYLFVLLALLVMTILGLSVVVITQTEVQIGAAEKTVTRVLYGADSGARVQLAYKMVGNEGRKARFNFVENVTRAGADFAENVDTSSIMVAYKGACNLCTINEDSENRKVSLNLVTNAQGRRLGLGASPVDDVAQANKLVTIMYFVQPQDEPVADIGLRTFDPEQTDDNPLEPGLDVIIY